PGDLEGLDILTSLCHVRHLQFPGRRAHRARLAHLAHLAPPEQGPGPRPGGHVIVALCARSPQVCPRAAPFAARSPCDNVCAPVLPGACRDASLRLRPSATVRAPAALRARRLSGCCCPATW